MRLHSLIIAASLLTGLGVAHARRDNDPKHLSLSTIKGQLKDRLVAATGYRHWKITYKHDRALTEQLAATVQMKRGERLVFTVQPILKGSLAGLGSLLSSPTVYAHTQAKLPTNFMGKAVPRFSAFGGITLADEAPKKK